MTTPDEYREIIHQHVREWAEETFDTEEEVEQFLAILYSGPTTGEAMAARLQEARRRSYPIECAPDQHTEH